MSAGWPVSQQKHIMMGKCKSFKRLVDAIQGRRSKGSPPGVILNETGWETCSAETSHARHTQHRGERMH